jgi:hypothetical protein
MESRAPLNPLLGPLFLFLSLLLCIWPVLLTLGLTNVNRVPLRSISLDIFRIGQGQEHSSHQVRSVKPLPKRPRILL